MVLNSTASLNGGTFVISESATVTSIEMQIVGSTSTGGYGGAVFVSNLAKWSDAGSQFAYSLAYIAGGALSVRDDATVLLSLTSLQYSRVNMLGGMYSCASSSSCSCAHL